MSAFRGLVQNHAWRPDSEQSLRDECRLAWEAAGLSARAHGLRRITVVGGIDMDFGDPASRDAQFLGMTLSYALASGILIDPDFTIDNVTFRDGRDFLRETRAADMIFIPRILNAAVPERFTHDTRKAGPVQLEEQGVTLRDPFANAVSPLHDTAGWRRRCHRAGARLIVTFGGTQDIGSNTFEGDGRYRVLVPTPATTLDVQSAVLPPHALYGRKTDLPYTWMGVMADRAWLGHIYNRTHASNTTLAKLMTNALSAADLRPTAWLDGPSPIAAFVRNSVLPGLRAMFKLKGNNVSLDGLHGKTADPQSHNGPKRGMHP